MFVARSSIEDAIKYASEHTDKDEIFIIGGASIYDYCLENDLIDRVLVSEMKFRVNRTDGLEVRFPELDGKWQRTVLNEYKEFTFSEYLPKLPEDSFLNFL